MKLELELGTGPYRDVLERHRELLRAAGHRTMEAWSLHMLALVQIGIGKVDAARSHARQALDHFREAGDVAGITLILDDLASIAVHAGIRRGQGDRTTRSWPTRWRILLRRPPAEHRSRR